MAAGLSLPQENINKFRRKIADSYTTQVDTEMTIQNVVLDEVLSLQSITPDYIKEFHRLAPFGAGNPNLLFATRGVQVLSNKIIGKNQNHRKLTIKDSLGSSTDVLWWNSTDLDLPSSPLDIAYNLAITSYRGQEQSQLTLKHFRQSSESPILIKESKPTIIDHRTDLNPEYIVDDLLIEFPGIQIWAEYHEPENIVSVPRLSLIKSPELLIWTTPPSQSVLKDVLERVSPSRIFLFANTPPDHSNRKIIELILGMLRHLHESGKPFDPELMAQSIAQTSAIIQTGIDWLHNHGDYDLSKLRTDNKIFPGSGKPTTELGKIDQRFNLLLDEINSYRIFLVRQIHNTYYEIHI